MSVFDMMSQHQVHQDFHRRMLMAAAIRQITEYQIPEELDCDVELLNGDLWKQFHALGTEMIITKNGRRMFPSLTIRVTGLRPGERYGVAVEMCPLGGSRWTRSRGKWGPAETTAAPQLISMECPTYVHPDSPATGERWSHPIYFNRLKLTNNPQDKVGNMLLSSMYRYQPRIRIFRVGGTRAAEKYFVFPETEFIAVTAYQNNCITQLKIDTNPFAKGFRKFGKGKRRIRDKSPSDSSNQEKKSCIAQNPDRLSSPEYIPSGSPSSSTSSGHDMTYVDLHHYYNSPAVPLNPLKFIQMKENIINYMHMEMAERPLRPVDVCREENRIKGSSFTIRAILGEH